MSDHIVETLRMFNTLRWHLDNAPTDITEIKNELGVLITYMVDNFELGDVTKEYITNVVKTCEVPEYKYLNSLNRGAIPIAIIRYITNRNAMNIKPEFVPIDHFQKLADMYADLLFKE